MTAPPSLPIERQQNRSELEAGSLFDQTVAEHSLHTLPTAPLLLLQKQRPGRKAWSTPSDPHPHNSYGDTIREKPKNGIRVFFQNVKGLSHSTGLEDYNYYMSSLKAYDVDVAGLAETNTAWQHPHLQQDFRKIVHKHFRQSKISFGSPNQTVDSCSLNETYQSGGVTTVTQGTMTASIYGNSIYDDTGLGRWAGFTLRGKEDYKLSIITAYRTCGGNVKTSSVGSVYSREYLYFRSQGIAHPNPRRLFFTQIGETIRRLKEAGHIIILMMDANSDLSTDHSFQEFVAECDLHDVHRRHPPPSTYIGSAHRRIDYIFGCETLIQTHYRSGSLSYYEGPHSDHRGLFVDIILPEFAKYMYQQKMAPASHRALHTGNPELVSAYLSEVRKYVYYQAHKMVARINHLYQRHETMEKDELTRLLTGWDADQGRALAAAEHKLSRPPKKYQWSPTLRNSALIRKYWVRRLRELTHNECYHDCFQRWQRDIQRYDPQFVLPRLTEVLSIESVRRELNLATKAFRKAQSSSVDLRLKSYEDLIGVYTSDANPSTKAESQRKAKVLMTTIQTETCRKTFGCLRSVVKPIVHSGLSSLLVPQHPSDPHHNANSGKSVHEILRETPSEDLQWETVIDRSDMERHLLDYNREAFRAAAASPCGHGLIYNAVKFTGLSPAANDVLKGIVPPEWHGDDQALKEFLASFTIPNHIADVGPIGTNISEEDVTTGFRRWRETTTTSPSGRHLGHYKALIQDPECLACLTKFLHMTLFHGIAIPRWCQATSVLIEKDPGRPCINRLRIIHLFEADFNFLLKILWGSRLVKRAVEHDLLHDGQFGSVPGKTTMDPIMLTQLTTDLSRILKVNMARFDNDASACYDRIIVAFGMLAARRCGMPENAIRTHSSALQLMQYAVKTVYGVSIDKYQGTDIEPLFGTGQGSGASPAVWLSLVVLLLNTLEKLVPERLNFESPNGLLTHSRLVDAFVDDTSLGINDFYSEMPMDDLVQRLQEIAQTWERILSLSGGALNLKKCSWYIMYWDWVKGRPQLRVRDQDDPTVNLKMSFTPVPSQVIPRMSLHTSSRVLGVQLSPSGNFSEAIRVYKAKADSFAARIKSPRIGLSEAIIFHRSIYVPTMRYGLAAISASEEDLAGIQSKVLASLLQKMHVSEKIPTSIRHGPIELGGLDLYDMRTELGIESLKFLRNSVFSNSAAGQLIIMNLQYLQLEAGIGESILENPQIDISYLTPSWLTSVRNFLSKHNMSITLTDQPTIQAAGPHDQFIMQSQHLSRYTPRQQHDLNLVRIYLQVSTLADMTDADQPNRIQLPYLEGQRPREWEETMTWPRQSTPSHSQRRLWKRFIESSYLRYIPYWKQNPLYTASRTRSTFRESMEAPPQTETCATKMPLLEYLKTLPRTQRRLVGDVVQVADDVQVWRAFRSKERLFFATDGGLLGTHGTFGWVLTSSKHILFTCGGPVDGPRDTANSTRCELSGIASALLVIASISRNWGLPHRCTFRCITDSRAALSKIHKQIRRRHVDHRQPYDSDLLLLIRSLLIEIRRIVAFKWVKGHQDAIKSYDSLPRSVKLNIDADFIATRYRERGKLKSTPKVDHCLAQRVSISILGSRLTSQYDSCIRYHINGYHLKQYMQARKDWNDDTWNTIDFGMFGRHCRRLSTSHRAFNMKLVHNQLPLGFQRHQRSTSKDDSLKKCPCCGMADEDEHHLFRCTENPFQTTGITQLRRDTVSGPHPLRKLLTEGITHWVNTGSSNFQVCIPDYPSHMREAVRTITAEQAAIGWENAIKGFLSKSWMDIASMEYGHTNKSITEGERRMRRCMDALFKFSRGIWKSRNSVLHESEEAVNQRMRSATADTIIYLHSQADQICHEDRYLCELPLDKILRSSPSTQRRWLKRMQDSKILHTRRGERQTLITSLFSSF